MNKLKVFFICSFIIGASILEYFGFLRNPQVLGLFLDVVGAYFLAQSFIVKNLEDIVAESRGNETKRYPGGSENFEISLYQQGKEAVTGFILLATGFIFQGIGVVYPEFILPCGLGVLSVILGLLAIVVIHTRLFRKDRLDQMFDAKDAEMSKKGYV